MIAVPAGATDAYVMVVSSGEMDGAYTKMTLTADSNPIDTSTSTGVGGGSSTSATTTSTAATGTGAGGGGGTDDQTVGGCGCSVPGGEETQTGAAIAAIAALGLIASRRRRR
jgi:MYXO-CTERM domain-containing protein